MKKILHMGCGNKKIKGAVGLDLVALPGVDVVHNLNIAPYPFIDKEFDEVYAFMVLEHVDNLMLAIAEIHRIMKLGGILRIKVPYYNSTDAFTDPTHKKFFSEKTFQYFTEGFQWNFYTKTRFKLIKLKLQNNSDTLTQRFRNHIPGKSLLKFFLWNMYDEVYAELESM